MARDSKKLARELGAKDAQRALDSGDYGYHASNKGLSTLTLIDDYWSFAVDKLPIPKPHDRKLVAALAAEYRRAWREHIKLDKNPPVPAWTVDATGRLDLADQERIPSSIKGLKTVRDLSLYGMRLGKIDPVVFTLPNVEKAYLQENKLARAPDGLRSWKKLAELHIGDNPLTEIDVICDLVTLRYLDLSATRLTALPENIGNLRNLKALDLFQAKATWKELPASFAKLTALRKIRLPLDASPQVKTQLHRMLPKAKLATAQELSR